jgi:histone deacetylase complex regulatory component SIN3
VDSPGSPSLDGVSVMRRVSIIFAGHPELIRRFSTFRPSDWSLTPSDDGMEVTLKGPGDFFEHLYLADYDLCEPI